MTGSTAPGRRAWLLPGVLALAAVTWLYAGPALRQDQGYHQFADDRTVLCIPNFANVLSNLPFLVVGAAGVWFVLGAAPVRKNLTWDGSPEPSGRLWRAVPHDQVPSQVKSRAFLTPGERWPYLVFFLGVGFTAIGSAYYHLQPDNARLVWDRLPMAIAFMGLTCGLLADWVHPRLGKGLLVPLLGAGLASVLWWAWCDDLRPYYLVQFYPLAVLPLLMLVFRPRYSGTAYLVAALACYVAAKVCEQPYDGSLLRTLGGTLSGHTLKHLLAALGAACLLRMLQRRQPAGHLGESGDFV